jgi:hypothetical protein
MLCPCWCCSYHGAWPRGFGAWRCRSFVPALWHVILAKLPYLTLLPIRCALRTSNRRTQTAQRFYVGLPSPPTLKLPVVSCRELERAASLLPQSLPLCPQHQIFLSFSFSSLQFFFPYRVFILSFHTTYDDYPTAEMAYLFSTC